MKDVMCETVSDSSLMEHDEELSEYKIIASFDFESFFEWFERLWFITENRDEVDEIYFSVMSECKWFPYVGCSEGITLLSDVMKIIETSRGKSQRQEKRIDKIILSYYTSNKIEKVRCEWCRAELDKCTKKILEQSIVAYLRGEYVLTISCLATMWEGLILQKAHITYRQKMEKTKQNLHDLIVENNFKTIFSDYFNRFIVGQCNCVDDVIEGIPNRNGVAHSWYKKYPNNTELFFLPFYFSAFFSNFIILRKLICGLYYIRNEIVLSSNDNI